MVKLSMFSINMCEFYTHTHTYSSRARAARHVVTVAILGAAGWLQGALQLFALSPKHL